jgi:hypothetical protein
MWARILLILLLAVPAWAANDTQWSQDEAATSACTAVGKEDTCYWNYDGSGYSPALRKKCAKWTIKNDTSTGTIHIYSCYNTSTSDCDRVWLRNQKTGAYEAIVLDTTDFSAEDITWHTIRAYSADSNSGRVVVQCND